HPNAPNVHQSGLSLVQAPKTGSDRANPVKMLRTISQILLLQELDIMRKVLSEAEFATWAEAFLPDLHHQKLSLEPGQVKDRSDGHLVHLDGVNFSRAWCLYPLKDNNNAYNLATEHLDYSLSKITDGDYAGQHWLGSFALYAFKTKSEASR
ncbi:MAG: DUF2891 family protein, partial [Bacteroidota bacterium]